MTFSKRASFLLIALIIISTAFYSLENRQSRLYIVKFIAFNTGYELYCAYEECGYYKYPVKIEDKTVYLTYEGRDFFNRSKFDENFTLFKEFYPSTVWTNNNGTLFNLKKKYSPVIEKNRERKEFPYGFGKN
jgi:hypothetical protein